jgi:predicted RNase H-like nuclease (RuvC/YqgF family)
MRFTSLLRTTAFLSAGFLAALCTPAQDPPSQQDVDPLAAAARKARAEQQNAPKPKKVYTNDDFAPTPPPKASEAKTGAAQSDSSTKTDADLAAENDPKTEVYWRKRFSKVRDKLKTAETEVGVLQRELDKNEVQYYPDPQKALMQQYSRKDINDNRAKLEAKQKEVESLKKQLSDMEEDLRRAGGDPGWAR